MGRTSQDIEWFIGRSLLSEGPAWPVDWDPEQSFDPIIAAIDYHGVTCLLLEMPLGDRGWPPGIIEKLEARRTERVKWELRHHSLLIGLVRQLHCQGVVSAFIKGTALAYAHYPHAFMRERGDSDLIIGVEQLDLARKALVAAGFLSTSGQAKPNDGAYQEIWSWGTDKGPPHEIDLHWRMLNSPALSALSFRADQWHLRPIPRLAPDAETFSNEILLAHACAHRAMHIVAPYFVGQRQYYGGDRLIWLWDIKLLAERLDDQNWDAFTKLAKDEGIALVCLAALELTRERFGIELPARIIDDLSFAENEQPSDYLLRQRQVRRFWSDLQSIPRLRSRLGFAFGRLLPAPHVLREKYPHHQNYPAWILYLMRLGQWLRRRSRSGR